MPERRSSRKPRRAEPIDKRVASTGEVTYTFQVDVGTKPNGNRDRDRFTYRTLTEARREYRRITSEVAEGRYVRRLKLTVDEACDEWLEGRRGIRRITIDSYKNDLKPVRRRLGSKQLARVTKADGDGLVTWMLTEARTSPRHYRPESHSSQVAAFVTQFPKGVAAAEVKTQFPDIDAHTCLTALARSGRVTRLGRGIYAPSTVVPGSLGTGQGVKPITVRSTLTTFGMVVQSYVDQGALPRNVIALVERPPDEIPDDDEEDGKTWTLAEVEIFREYVRSQRLYACWLLSCYGMRRSEVLGTRWKRFAGSKVRVRRGRVAIGSEIDENLPKSRRSRRDLELPGDVVEALSVLRVLQMSECRALGIPWSEDRLIAVHEDGTPIRPEYYSDEFQRLRKRAGLRRIVLKGLRATSVSLMLSRGIPPHIVAAWHGHDPAVSLRIYNDPRPEDLRAAGAALFE